MPPKTKNEGKRSSVSAGPSERTAAEDAFDVDELEESNAVAKREETDVSQQGMGMAIQPGSVTGDFTPEDFAIPRLNLVQSTGDLSSDFKPGTVLYNKSLPLVPPNEEDGEWGSPIEIIILTMKKQFQENKKFDPNDLPEIYDTLEEVLAIDGATLKYEGDVEPTHKPMMTYSALIKAPKGNDDAETEFSMEDPEGNMWELVLWTVAGTQYTRVAKTVNTTGVKLSKNGRQIHNISWKMKTRREKVNGNQVYVPKITSLGPLSEEMFEFADNAI